MPDPETSIFLPVSSASLLSIPVMTRCPYSLLSPDGFGKFSSFVSTIQDVDLYVFLVDFRN